MPTTIAIDETKFRLNGELTYAAADPKVRGLLFNSRMVQALFDDECPDTRCHWAYPDTGAWDADRNTDEFCAALPEYRRHGLLAVTVGLQGGGSIYTADVYDHYLNSAFRPDGSIKPEYLDRLTRVLQAADACGMVVIVNYFYWKQVAKIPDDAVIRRLTEAMTQWLLLTGRRNILVDVANEANPFWKRPLFAPERVHELIEIVQATTLDGRRLPVGASTGGGEQIPVGRWRDIEDFALPHGNGCTPDRLQEKLRRLKDTAEHRNRPRPILVNEDSVFIENLEVAVAEGCSWGFYCQGYGSDYQDRMNWKEHGREDRCQDLSGFQTVPVNWSINTPMKQAFFERIRQLTQPVK